MRTRRVRLNAVCLELFELLPFDSRSSEFVWGMWASAIAQQRTLQEHSRLASAERPSWFRAQPHPDSAKGRRNPRKWFS